MTRLSHIDRATFTDEQKELFDSIAGGPRAAKRPSLLDANGNLTGPFHAFVHAPAFGRHWSAIGEGLRFRASLDRRLFELAILVIAVAWQSGHEWAAHAHLAREAGVSGALVEALRRGERPSFEKPDEEALYDFVHGLVTKRRVPDSVYNRVVGVLGEPQTVELVNAVGYYLGLAAMLNAFEVHPPAGLDDPWPKP
jgi:4-carboxymuconolactone decarboxylase